MGSDIGLISGGSGGYVNLSSPSSSEAIAAPTIDPTLSGGSPTITFTGGTNNSILEIGLLALVIIFLAREFA